MIEKYVTIPEKERRPKNITLHAEKEEEEAIFYFKKRYFLGSVIKVKKFNLSSLSPLKPLKLIHF